MAEEDKLAEAGRRLRAGDVLDPEASRAIFERIARLAQRMAGAASAHVALVARRGMRLVAAGMDSGGEGSRAAQLAQLAMQSSQVLWIEDLAAQGWSEAYPLAAGELVYDFYAAAPIILPNGRRVGALAIVDALPRAYDADMAERLADHAAFVADEWERSKAVEALAKSQRRLSLATELANINVWEMDYRNRELSSDGAEPTDETTYESFAADAWRGVHPNDLEHAKALWDEHVANGVPYRVVHRMMRADGPHYWVEMACEALKDEQGRIVSVIGATRNVDKEKRSELTLAKARDEAEAANRAKSLFLATMSHEIRTPLNGVLGMTQAMAMDELTPVQRERLEVVHASGEALLAILNDILDLAKIEAGKLELEEIDFDLEEIVRGAHQAFTAQANAKGLDFTLDIARGSEGVYRGDPTRIRQILYNLLSNALKFTDQGGQIRVDARFASETLTISVADTGVGIPADRLPLLFGRFAQADASTTRRFGGTGLGLAICRELAMMMGGLIEVESEPDKGSKFTLSLPLERVGAPRASPLAAGPAGEGPAPNMRLRVLAAEDNPVNQLVLKTLLHQAGIEPVVVENGVQAVEAWKTEPWDLILMDVQMPRMDGPTAARAIREAEALEGRRRTPIVALTANVMAHQLADYAAAGMDGHITKPLEAARLFEALAAVFETPSSEDDQAA